MLLQFEIETEVCYKQIIHQLGLISEKIKCCIKYEFLNAPSCKLYTPITLNGVQFRVPFREKRGREPGFDPT